MSLLPFLSFCFASQSMISAYWFVQWRDMNTSYRIYTTPCASFRQDIPLHVNTQHSPYSMCLRWRLREVHVYIFLPSLHHKPAPVSNVDIATTIHKRKSWIHIGHINSDQKRKSKSTLSSHTFIPRSFHPQLALPKLTSGSDIKTSLQSLKDFLPVHLMHSCTETRASDDVATLRE